LAQLFDASHEQRNAHRKQADLCVQAARECARIQVGVRDLMAVHARGAHGVTGGIGSDRGELSRGRALRLLDVCKMLALGE